MHIKNALLAVIFCFATFAIGNGQVFAESPSPFCKPSQSLFDKVGKAFESLDIRKTVQNMIVTAVTDTSYSIIANRNPDQMLSCTRWILENADPDKKYEYLLKEIQDACPGQKVESDDCSDFIETFDANTNPSSSKPFNRSQTSGSLLGMANYLEGALITEPIPVNLAYFWNDSIKKIPMAGTAFAADVSYPVPFITTVLEIWKTFRNVAYGILSIIMITIGVMIMMRKKLSPQLVVTVQYALPRIALAVILITFSYPIGAVLARSMFYFRELVLGVLSGVMSGSGIWPPSLGVIVALIISRTIGGVGAGLLNMALTGILVLVAGAIYILIWVKAFFIYFKLIFSIVFAPITFALGAIPGNEKATGDWFKHALAHVLSFVGMFAYVSVVNMVLLLIAESPFNPGSLSVGTGLGATFVIIFFPILMIWGYIQAFKFPKKVEELIVGEDKSKMRKK